MSPLVEFLLGIDEQIDVDVEVGKRVVQADCFRAGIRQFPLDHHQVEIGDVGGVASGIRAEQDYLEGLACHGYDASDRILNGLFGQHLWCHPVRLTIVYPN